MVHPDDRERVVVHFVVHFCDEMGDSCDQDWTEGKYHQQIKNLVAECEAGDHDEPNSDGLRIGWIERVEDIVRGYGWDMDMVDDGRTTCRPPLWERPGLTDLLDAHYAMMEMAIALEGKEDDA